MTVHAAKSSDARSKKDALVREMLVRVAGKWTLLVIDALEGKQHVRFSQLRVHLGEVSQKMLTQTLRRLERDGLITRRVHAEVPPRVEDTLTALGESLGEAVCGMWTWVDSHLEDVERSRQRFDRSKGTKTKAQPESGQ